MRLPDHFRRGGRGDWGERDAGLKKKERGDKGEVGFGRDGVGEEGWEGLWKREGKDGGEKKGEMGTRELSLKKRFFF